MKHVFKIDTPVIQWLLDGDVSIQYLTQRDLLNNPQPDLQKRIEFEGWGAKFLAQRQPEGHWGNSFYNPKWICSHYTLLDLKNLNISPNQSEIHNTIQDIAVNLKTQDGGVNPAHHNVISDVCINGMFLNYACYFGLAETYLHSIIDFILDQQMPDGGFNCQNNRQGATHSSLHSTISVLEGIQQYAANGYTYRLDELKLAAAQSLEFILIHHLYKSDHTGQIINKSFLTFSYPARWKYNILRALDYFQSAKIPWNDRMQDALDVVKSKRSKDGKWKLQSAHPGQAHFKMEQGGKPSRWNTLMSLRVLNFYAHP